jgi:hypothetical protein
MWYSNRAFLFFILIGFCGIPFLDGSKFTQNEIHLPASHKNLFINFPANDFIHASIF